MRVALGHSPSHSAGPRTRRPGAAQDKYPSRPIKIVVPYAPGGATDIVARLLGDQMQQDDRSTVVVENKPGAFGIIAIEEMARRSRTATR